MALTLRNWLIGFYIKEYEQNGLDRAKYRSNTIKHLADELPATAYRVITAHLYKRVFDSLYSHHFLIFHMISNIHS